MTPEGKKRKNRIVVAAVSGGPDSVYLLLGKLFREKGTGVVIGHVNYATRGMDSKKDQALVEYIGKLYGYETVILSQAKSDVTESRGGSGLRGNFPAGFERAARDVRYRFLRDLAETVGAEAIALAHTADDQVETILMRVFEGAGIGGLKGIPRETGDGIVRPILDLWKEDILDDLKKRKIPYRIDRSNLDTRFERNWVRNVLLPLLVKRYGKAVKKRIFTLGERFRELDTYLETEAGNWMRRNVTFHSREMDGTIRFRREAYSALPSVLRVKILQGICFDRLGVAPNERLIAAMERNIRVGGPSAKVHVGKGWELANRYGEARFMSVVGGRKRTSAGAAPIVHVSQEYQNIADPTGGRTGFVLETRGKITRAQAKRLAAKGDAEVFDAAALALPLTVRPLRAGDRIRPFGRDAEKKVKEILIDRKVPREARWGRPVVCDAEGAILWIPGVLRSALAPVTPESRKTALLRIRAAEWTRIDRVIK